jgi:DNA repair protein RadC
MKIYETVLEERGEYNGPTDASNFPNAVKILTDYGLHKRAEECMILLTLNEEMEVTGIFEVARGNVDEIVLDLREIIKRACLANATHILIAHNHTTSDSEPSEEDIELTEDLKKCCEYLGIVLIDHIIVTMEEASSVFEHISR